MQSEEMDRSWNEDEHWDEVKPSMYCFLVCVTLSSGLLAHGIPLITHSVPQRVENPELKSAELALVGLGARLDNTSGQGCIVECLEKLTGLSFLLESTMPLCWQLG